MSWCESELPDDDVESVMSVTSSVLSGIGRDATRRVFVLSANETNSSLIQDRIISPLKKAGIPCLYDRNSFPLGFTLEKIHTSCITRHPVTILPITKRFNEEFSDNYIEKVFPIDYHIRHLVVCILLESGCKIPTRFESLTQLDFSGAQSDKDANKQEHRMVKAVKRKLERTKRKDKKDPNEDLCSRSETLSLMSDNTLVENQVDTGLRIEQEGSESSVEFVAINDLNNPRQQSTGVHVRYDKIQESDHKLEQRDFGIKYEEGISAFHAFYTDMHGWKNDIEEYIMQKVIPNAPVEKLAELLCFQNTRLEIAVLEAIRNRIITHLVPNIFSKKLIHSTNSSLISVESTLRLSFREIEDYNVTCEKILTYQLILSALVNARLLGVLSKELLPGDSLTPIITLLNLKQHAISPHAAVWTTQARITLECNVYYITNALQRIKEDVGSWKKVKTSITKSTLTSMRKVTSTSTYLDKLSYNLERMNESSGGKRTAEKILQTDKFAVLAATDFLACKIMNQDKLDDNLNYLRLLGYLMYGMNLHRTSRESTLVFQLSILVKLLESSKDEAFCVNIIEGAKDTQDMKCIGIHQVLEHLKSTPNDQVRQFHSSMFGQLIYHPLRCVNKLAQKRTVLKRSIGDEAIKPKDNPFSVSFQQLQEINQRLILRECGDISLTSKDSVAPSEQDISANTRWAWNGHLFGSMVTVSVPSTLEEILGNDEDMKYQSYEEMPSVMFLSEMSLLHKLQKHDNIIDLYGFCRHPLPIFTITEHLENNLLEYLTERTTRDKFMSLYELVHDICIPVISAVQYCHTNEIVLRDVIAKNFRIEIGQNKSIRVKYCDLKLAKELQKNDGKYGSVNPYFTILGDKSEMVDDTNCYLGTENDNIAKRWSAPESFVEPYVFSKKSDAWMLSCTLYEILTHGCQPYTELYGTTSDDIMLQVMRGLRLKQPACIPTTIFDILLHGQVVIPAKRLSVDTLYDKVVAHSTNLPQPDPRDIKKIHFPPQRDRSQGMEPERGIPKQPYNYYYSSDSYCMGNHFPCRLEDITATDVQMKRAETAGAFGYVTLEEKLDTRLFPHGRSRLEINKLRSLSHQNIGRVLSCVLQEDVTIQVSEYYDTKTTLLNVALHKQCTDKLIDYLMQVASGMAYLHENYLIHCDLRAAHIYISQNDQAKVGRLGRACLLEVGLYDLCVQDSVKIRQMLKDQIRWSPIEVVCGNIFSQASDIFMFAQLCWEVFNACDANKSFGPNMLVPFPHSADSEIQSLLTQRKHQLQPPSCPEWIYKLMKMCWLDERSRRPSFELIGQCLQNRCLDPIDTHEDNDSEATVYGALQREDEYIFGYFTEGTTKHQEDNDYTYYTDTPFVRSNTYAVQDRGEYTEENVYESCDVYDHAQTEPKKNIISAPLPLPPLPTSQAITENIYDLPTPGDEYIYEEPYNIPRMPPILSDFHSTNQKAPPPIVPPLPVLKSQISKPQPPQSGEERGDKCMPDELPADVYYSLDDIEYITYDPCDIPPIPRGSPVQHPTTQEGIATQFKTKPLVQPKDET